MSGPLLGPWRSGEGEASSSSEESKVRSLHFLVKHGVDGSPQNTGVVPLSWALKLPRLKASPCPLSQPGFLHPPACVSEGIDLSFLPAPSVAGGFSMLSINAECIIASP